MSCLRLFLIGIDEDILPEIRRELLNRWAGIASEFPNVSSLATNVMLVESEPALFILGLHEGDDVTQLKQLYEMFPRRPILVLLSPHQDSGIMLKVMRAGAAQVVALPFRADDFSEALDCVASTYDIDSGHALTVAVTGATGGAGATTIALNLAHELAQMKKAKCILVELSLRMGILTTYLDVQPSYTTADLLARFDRLDNDLVDQSLTKVAENFFILPGPYSAIQSETMGVDDTLRLLDILRQLATIVVLDVPASYDDMFFRSLTLADKSVLVVEQKVASIRGAQLICNAIGSHLPLLAINRFDPSNGISADRIREALNDADVVTIADDQAVGLATNNGRLLSLEDSQSRALADIRQLARRLATDVTTDEAERAKEKSTLLGRLSHALSLS